jgi:superfamily II RNA helicase
MILNLFRVEKISVEGMMSHSFKERRHYDKQKQYAEDLAGVKKTMEEISFNTQQHGPHWKPLSDFYDTAAKYLKLQSNVIVCCFVYFLYVNDSFQYLKCIVRTLN